LATLPALRGLHRRRELIAKIDDPLRRTAAPPRRRTAVAFRGYRLRHCA